MVGDGGLDIQKINHFRNPHPLHPAMRLQYDNMQLPNFRSI